MSFNPSLPLLRVNFKDLVDNDDKIAYLLHRGIGEDELPEVPETELDLDCITCMQPVISVSEGGYSRSDLESLLEDLTEIEDLYEEWEAYDAAILALYDDIEDDEVDRLIVLQEAEQAEKQAANLQRQVAELHKKAAHLKNKANA